MISPTDVRSRHALAARWRLPAWRVLCYPWDNDKQAPDTDAEDRRREKRDGRSRDIRRAGCKGRARGAASRRRRLVMVGRAPRAAGISRPLPRRHAASRRAHQHQSGGGWVRRVRSLARQLHHRSRQSQRPRRAGQFADRLYRRHGARGRDRACFFLDRRAHQHAMERLRRRRKLDPAVRAAAGRRVAWSILGSPRSGLINTMLAWAGLDWRIDLYSMAGLILVFGMYYAPYIYLFTASALRNMDPSLEEAAEIAGIGPVRTLFTITFPLIAPAIISGMLLSFIVMLGIYGIPAVLGAPANISV